MMARQITLYAADPRPKAKEAVLYTLRAGGLKADVQFLAARFKLDLPIIQGHNFKE